MISQADIIRSLVNKNCTDETIMSTALSPDCTLPKLLQKFTEAERFDLALDVYMKMGMDVVPLWKTWAMRCLRNRDFQGARDKFRHCFQRFRKQSQQCKATKALLDDILNELVRMKETKLALNEELDLIVKGDRDKRDLETLVKSRPAKIDQTKPKIFSECMHYLKEYGTNELLVKFYVDNELWHEAIVTLFKTRADPNDNSIDEFFISHVISPSEATGHLDKAIAELLELDPRVNLTSRYFRALYNHLAKRHNTLYYVQHEIGDHIMAAESQIHNFFLKKPAHDYKELNQRVPNLINASDEYQQHLRKLRAIDDTSEVRELGDEPNHSFITQLTREDTQIRLKTIKTQIEITRNFAINEVPGCINNIKVVCEPDFGRKGVGLCGKEKENFDDTDSPVTLFDSDPRRKTFLAALILIYFDLDCSNNLSESGFELATELINESNLDKLSVFKTAVNIIIDDESSDIIENASLLLKRLREDYIACALRAKLKSPAKHTRRSASSKGTSVSTSESNSISKSVISRPKESKKNPAAVNVNAKPTSGSSIVNRSGGKVYNFEPADKSILPGSDEAARLLCDEVIRDSIESCPEEDYKMELIKLLSPEAKVVLYIELGKLSIAQRLAFDMKRPDFVKMVLREAEKLNQDHVKDVCQHWLAKH